MYIIVWRAKHDDQYYDASTPEKSLAAFMEIFSIMDEQGDFACCPPEGVTQKALFKKAKKGDKEAAKKFILLRRDYEYEHVSIEEVQTVQS